MLICDQTDDKRDSVVASDFDPAASIRRQKHLNIGLRNSFRRYSCMDDGEFISWRNIPATKEAGARDADVILIARPIHSRMARRHSFFVPALR